MSGNAIVGLVLLITFLLSLAWDFWRGLRRGRHSSENRRHQWWR